MTPPAPLPGAVRILHLSDLGVDAARWKELAPVARKLAEAVKALRPAGLSPDLIAITGDISATGKARDLGIARDWLREVLLPAAGPSDDTPLPPDRLVLIPGSRDLNQRAMNLATRSTSDALLEAKTSEELDALVRGVLNNATDRAMMMRRFRLWRAFSRSLGASATPSWEPWSRHRLEVARPDSPLLVDVVRLSSTWAASGEGDRYGQLVLGAHQVVPLMDVAQPAPLVVALMRHPPEWITWLDRQSKATLLLECPLLLLGHDEQPDEHVELRPGRREPGERAAHVKNIAGHVFHPDPKCRNAALIELSTADLRIHRLTWDPVARTWDRRPPIEPLRRVAELPPQPPPPLRLRVPAPIGHPPPQPYPELDPCEHPASLGGRRLLITRLRRLIDGGGVVFGLFAASGAGKSSVLRAGLVPSLRGQLPDEADPQKAPSPIPVAYEAHPDRPDLAESLLSGLLEEPLEPDAHQPRRFAALLARLRDQERITPVLVLDQVEDLFPAEPTDLSRAALGRLGLLLAATARAPGGPSARWVLCYRHEHHGQVQDWMADVLRYVDLSEAERAGLQRDLRAHGGFRSESIPLLGDTRDQADPLAAAREAFYDAITRPLSPWRADQQPQHAFRMREEDAGRLADAFASQRLKAPHDPLTPELQVVLGRLVKEAGPVIDGVRWIPVPSDAQQLEEQISSALRQHLQDRLEQVAVGADRTRRATAALLLLSLLVSADGRRRARPLRELGAQGGARAKLLDELQAQGVWLLRRESRKDEKTGEEQILVSLPHDRLATEVHRLLRDPAGRVRFHLDEKTVELWDFARQRAAAWDGGKGDPSAVELSWGRYGELERNEPTLPWDEVTRPWWTAAQRAAEARTGRYVRWGALVAVVLLVFLGGVWVKLDMSALESAVRSQPPASGEPLRALYTLMTRYHYDGAELADVLGANGEAGSTFNTSTRDEIFAIGPRGLTDGERLAEIPPLVKELAPHVEGATDDESFYGALLAAVEVVRFQDTAVADDAKQAVVDAMRKARGQPPAIIPTDGQWSMPIAGTFEVGCLDPGDSCQPDETRHAVTLTRYRVRKNEETIGQYQRFDKEHLKKKGWPADWPVTNVSWYEASAYAAWLGAALPTEAQWEVATRGGCDVSDPSCDPSWYTRTAYWSGPDEADLARVGFYLSTSRPELKALYRKGLWPAKTPLEGAPPHPLGLLHEHGNAIEWVTDWYAPYPATSSPDPRGPVVPANPADAGRVLRGGSWFSSALGARSAFRDRVLPLVRDLTVGFRLVLPQPTSALDH